MENDQPTETEIRKIQFEFECWLLENVIGIPDDGNPIVSDEMFDPKKMFIYELPVNKQKRLFLVKIADIPAGLKTKMGWSSIDENLPESSKS